MDNGGLGVCWEQGAEKQGGNPWAPLKWMNTMIKKIMMGKDESILLGRDGKKNSKINSGQFYITSHAHNFL